MQIREMKDEQRRMRMLMMTTKMRTWALRGLQNNSNIVVYSITHLVCYLTIARHVVHTHSHASARAHTRVHTHTHTQTIVSCLQF